MRAAFTIKGYESRIRKIMRVRKRYEEMDVNKLHVKLQKGNSKTGHACWTVSLLPVIDCTHNCSACRLNCYDLKADLIYTQCINDRCKNSVIHEKDPARYWYEVNLQVKANYVTELRINVGGDLTEDDFTWIKILGEDNPKVHILFFTKNYEGINSFLNSNSFPENIHPILSAWEGLELSNPHRLPCSHVLYEDGRTTAPEYGAYYCGGNCTKCAFNGEGCWTLKRGEHVIFRAH